MRRVDRVGQAPIPPCLRLHDTFTIAPNVPLNGAQGLVLIQQMWRELQAAVKDPEKSKSLEERIRKEADLFRQRGNPPKPAS